MENLRVIAAGIATLTAPNRTAMRVEDYLRAGTLGHHACFACREVADPRPVRAPDKPGRERRCGACGQESALPLDVALREGWLQVSA